MAKEYIDQRDGGFYLAGTRVSLDSVVYAFLRGESAEGIAESFPSLTLEQVYGGIAFYLAHREEIDAYLRAARVDFDRLREESDAHNLALHASWSLARESLYAKVPDSKMQSDHMK